MVIKETGIKGIRNKARGNQRKSRSMEERPLGTGIKEEGIKARGSEEKGDQGTRGSRE